MADPFNALIWFCENTMSANDREQDNTTARDTCQYDIRNQSVRHKEQQKDMIGGQTSKDTTGVDTVEASEEPRAGHGGEAADGYNGLGYASRLALFMSTLMMPGTGNSDEENGGDIAPQVEHSGAENQAPEAPLPVFLANSFASTAPSEAGVGDAGISDDSLGSDSDQESAGPINVSSREINGEFTMAQPVNSFVPGRVTSVNSTQQLIHCLDYITNRHGQQQAHARVPGQTGVILNPMLRPCNCAYRAGEEYDHVQLGQGTFGSVSRCTDKQSGITFARKMVSLSNFQRKEVEVLRQVENENDDENYFPNIFGVILENDVVYIFMTFVDKTWGYLARQLAAYPAHIREAYVRRLLKQLLLALKDLHLLQICHCDIKPDNCGCTDDGARMFLMDFGTVRLSTEEFSPKGMTPEYMSPEACRGTNSPKVDIWAAACTVYYMFTLKHPWADKKTTQHFEPAKVIEFLRHIAFNPWDMRTQYLEEIRELISEDLYKLLWCMLDPIDHTRYSAEECLNEFDRWERAERAQGHSTGAQALEMPAAVSDSAISSTSSTGQAAFGGPPNLPTPQTMKISQEVLSQLRYGGPPNMSVPRTMGRSHEGVHLQAGSQPLVCVEPVPNQAQASPQNPGQSALQYGLTPGAIAQALNCTGNPGQCQNPRLSNNDLVRQHQIVSMQLELLRQYQQTGKISAEIYQVMEQTLDLFRRVVQRVQELQRLQLSESQRQQEYAGLIPNLMHVERELQNRYHQELQQRLTEQQLQQRMQQQQPKPSALYPRPSETPGAIHAGRRIMHREKTPYARSRSNSSNQNRCDSPARIQTRTVSSDYMSVGSPAHVGSSASITDRRQSNEHVTEGRLSEASSHSSDARYLSRGSIDQSDAGNLSNCGDRSYSSTSRSHHQAVELEADSGYEPQRTHVYIKLVYKPVDAPSRIGIRVITAKPHEKFNDHYTEMLRNANELIGPEMCRTHNVHFKENDIDFQESQLGEQIGYQDRLIQVFSYRSPTTSGIV